MKTLLTNINERREEWLKLRAKTVGSSEIAVICGLSKYQSPLKLWREKTGRDKPQDDSDFLWLGRKLEPVVGELFERKTGKKLRPANALYCHGEILWATASPDFFTEDLEEVVETKARGDGMKQFYADGGAMHSDHLQLNWQLGITGLKKGHVAALCGGDPRQFYTPAIEFSEEIFGQCMAKAEEFMHYVRTDTEPPAMAMDKDILNLIERDAAKKVNLPDEAGDILAQFEDAKTEVEKYEALLDPHKVKLEECKAQIQQLLGDAGTGFWGKWEVVAKKVERAAYQAKASSYTRLTIKEKN